MTESSSARAGSEPKLEATSTDDVVLLEPVHDRPRDPVGDWTLLIMSTIIVILSFTMTVRDGTQVLIPGTNQPLPGLCAFRNWFNWDCPGCGMTRAFISMAHGKFSLAWAYNPTSLLFFPMVVIQIPFRSWLIWLSKKGRPQPNLGRWGLAPLFLLMFVMLGQWAVRSILHIVGA